MNVSVRRSALSCGHLMLALFWGCGKADIDTAVQSSRSAPTPTPVSTQDAAGHKRMLSTLAELAAAVPKDNRYYGDGVASSLRAVETQGQLTREPAKRFQFEVQLGMLELKLGNEQVAIRRLTSGYEKAQELFAEKVISRTTYLGAVFRLGLAYFRLGETENCCLRHNADSCLLPIRGGGVHTQERGSREAIGYFLEVLSNLSEKDDPKLYYETVWLLNIAHMTLGEHPQGVPEQYRIPAEAFQPQSDLPRFMNVAADHGVDTFGMSGGAAADDFDGDGRIDLMVGSWDLRDQLRLFKNVGAGGFEEQTTQAQLAGIPGGLNMVQADYNNDGHVDLLVLRGAWLFEKGTHPNSLLRNNGDGTFTDVTFAAGLANANYPTQTAAWADYDLDGDLDLYVGNEPTKAAPSAGQLFRNNGNGTFIDVASEAGVENLRFAKAVTWGDVDHDRYPDLFISNLHGENRLYHNCGDGTFVDIAEESGLGGFLASFPAFFCDFDNDGCLDLYVASYSTATHLVARHYLGQEVHEGRSRLYRGNGSGRFEDVASDVGLVEPTFAMGINFGDLDNDGYVDFYLGTGDIDYRHLVPNKMYRSIAGERFEDVSFSGGFSHLQKGHAIVFADFDLDGDLDVFQQMGGAYQGDKYSDAYYLNPGFSANWIAIDVVGQTSNTSAIGTKLAVSFREGDVSRTVYRLVNSGGSFGANPLRQTIGLARSRRVDRLEVFWPRTVRTQVFTDIAANQVIRVVENVSELESLDLSERP